jgi:hypothetical protein
LIHFEKKNSATQDVYYGKYLVMMEEEYVWSDDYGGYEG